MLYRLLSYGILLVEVLLGRGIEDDHAEKSSKEAMASDEIISRANPAIRDLNVGKIRS